MKINNRGKIEDQRFWTGLNEENYITCDTSSHFSQTMPLRSTIWGDLPSNVMMVDILGYFFELLCDTLSCFSQAMLLRSTVWGDLQRLTSWAVVPSNVWRLTSQVVVPRNVVEDNILGCYAKQCHKGWHLRLLCRGMSWKIASWVAVPSNAIKVDISGRCTEQCRGR